MRYAIVLAGIPGRISSGVKDALQERFSDNHVIRGAGAPLSDNKIATYDEVVVSDALRMAVDAVFGKSERPHGFCRNINRSCALQGRKKDSCGKTNDQSCFRLKPDYLVVLYQTGDDEQKLLDRFHHAALTIRLPKHCYGHLTKTTEECVNAIKSAYPVLGVVRKMLESAKTPLLLPVLNARTKDLDQLLATANRTGGKPETEAFKRTYFERSTGAYSLRDPLEFQPANPNIRHGIADPKTHDGIALSRVYRLGCQYLRDFHYDVHRKDERHLSADFAFLCREKGEKFPKGKNVNVTVDDCLPWET